MSPEALRAFTEGLPTGFPVTLPREALLELLDAATGTPGDLTTKQVATRLGRAPSTVRDMCRDGRLPGSYLFGKKDYRVPVATVTAYEAAQRAGRDSEAQAPTSPPRTPDLAAWRRVDDRKAS